MDPTYVRSQHNSTSLGLKFYKTRGNNGITKIFGMQNQNSPKTDSAKYLHNAISSPCFIKFQPQRDIIRLRLHICTQYPSRVIYCVKLTCWFVCFLVFRDHSWQWSMEKEAREVGGSTCICSTTTRGHSTGIGHEKRSPCSTACTSRCPSSCSYT